MTRIGLLIGALALALFIGVIALQTPTPRGLIASPNVFSAGRAMVDVREMAERPHPMGSPDHQRVQNYLVGRMTALGLTPALQVGETSPEGIRRLRRWGLDETTLPVNIVGILPGHNASAPAVLIMAHYDSVAKSPGAADDATGVASILEAVRAIKARGPAERDLIVVLTDGEELNLDGAKSFFKASSLPAHIGAVVNLEARGGGGRAMMFETGPHNRQTIDLFARTSARADGGATSNSLAVLIYELMPNGTDFMISRGRGIAGINLAFIGRPGQYHSPTSTPEALDQGSVQHIGSQALEATDAFLRSSAMPAATEPRVYADILGHGIVAHAPQTGWILLAITAALSLFAVWGGRHATGLTFADIGRGVLAGIWVIAAGLVLAQAVRLLAGPPVSADSYYTLMARLPWMEGGVGLTILSVSLVALAGRDVVGRGVVTGVVALAAVAATLLGGVNPVVLGAAAVALGLGFWSQGAPRSTWGAWLGLILLIGGLGAVVQAVAPTAAFLLIWPALLPAAAAALSALIGARLTRPASLIPPAVVTALGGAWIVSLAHPVFLGIGMDLPGVLAPLALLILMFARPLAPAPVARAMAGAAAACLILACGFALTARYAEPMAPPPPPAVG
ncbi:hypothetical protein BH09PSE1_BH09PSE1_21370 [soil metagenome]